MQDLNVVLKRRVILPMQRSKNQISQFQLTTNTKDPFQSNHGIVVKTDRVLQPEVFLAPVQLLDPNVKSFQAPKPDSKIQYVSLTIGDVLKIHNILKTVEHYYVKLTANPAGYYDLDMNISSRLKIRVTKSNDVNHWLVFEDDAVNALFNALLLKSSDRELIALFDDHWDLIEGNTGIYAVSIDQLKGTNPTQH